MAGAFFGILSSSFEKTNVRQVGLAPGLLKWERDPINSDRQLNIQTHK
jgi:hypothetical protein